MCIFTNDYYKERLDWVRAGDFTDRLTDDQIIDAYKVLSTHKFASLETAKIALRGMMYHKLINKLNPPIPNRDEEFEAVCKNYDKHGKKLNG